MLKTYILQHCQHQQIDSFFEMFANKSPIVSKKQKKTDK